MIASVLVWWAEPTLPPARFGVFDHVARSRRRCISAAEAETEKVRWTEAPCGALDPLRACRGHCAELALHGGHHVPELAHRHELRRFILPLELLRPHRPRTADRPAVPRLLHRPHSQHLEPQELACDPRRLGG